MIAYASEAEQSCEGLEVAASESSRLPVKNLWNPVTVRCVPDDDSAMPAWWVGSASGLAMRIVRCRALEDAPGAVSG